MSYTYEYNPSYFSLWNLSIGVCLLFGAWNLEFYERIFSRSLWFGAWRFLSRTWPALPLAR